MRAVNAPRGALLPLLLIACAPQISVFNSSPCASTLTFSEAHAAARPRVEGRLYFIYAGLPQRDGRAEEWMLYFVGSGSPRKVLVSCDRVAAVTEASSADPARDLAMADAVERWGRATDSPKWFADAPWAVGGGYVTSNVNDCAAPQPRKSETPSFFFCAPDAEKGALLLARHGEPSTQPLAYAPTGLELWPTYRTVALRETPDALPDGGSPGR